MSTDVSAGSAHATNRRFTRSGTTPIAEHRNRSSVVERLASSRWELRHGPSTDTYVLRDFDGKRLTTLNTSEHAAKQRRAWRAPVSLAARGADRFWLYRGHTYRCDRGLAWWDIEALVGEDGPADHVAAYDDGVVVRAQHARPHETAVKAVRHLREHGLEADALEGPRARAAERLPQRVSRLERAGSRRAA